MPATRAGLPSLLRHPILPLPVIRLPDHPRLNVITRACTPFLVFLFFLYSGLENRCDSIEPVSTPPPPSKTSKTSRICWRDSGEIHGGHVDLRGGHPPPVSLLFQVVKRNLAGLLLRRSGKSFIARLGSVSTTTRTPSPPFPLYARRGASYSRKKGLLKGRRRRRMYRDWRRCFNRRPSTPFPLSRNMPFHHRIVKNGREIPGFYTGWKTRFPSLRVLDVITYRREGRGGCEITSLARKR